MADADDNNSIPRRPITSNNKAIESKQQGQHVLRIGFSIKPAITEREATLNNNKNTPTPYYAGTNPSTANANGNNPRLPPLPTTGANESQQQG